MKLLLHVSRDTAVTIGVFFFMFAIAVYFNIQTPESDETGFGWEYGNIAEALVRGKGFANPFGMESGPTAWMPPLFVFLQAGAFYLFGIKSIAAMWVILLVKYVGIATCFYLLRDAVNQTDYRRYKYILVSIFMVLILINRGAYFRTVHDEWLILFFSCAMVSAFTTRIYNPSRRNTIYLSMLAFFLPLGSPPLALSFAVVEVGIFLWHRPESSSLKAGSLPTLILFSFLAASTLLWTYRNYRVFGTVVPIKSNLWFDFYQANALDEDGLVTNTTFLKYHPIRKNEIQEEYLIEKEPQFMEEMKELSLKWIPTHSSRLLQNIGRRAISAFLYGHNAEDRQRVKPGLLSPEDMEKLADAKLISLDDAPILYWISLTIPQSEFERQIRPLNLSNESFILQDWSARRQTLRDWANDPARVIRSFLVSFIPFFCLIFGFMVEKIRKNPLFILAAIIYLTYLAPYVLISYYRRYQVPLIGLHAIFIFFFICIFLEKFLRREIAFRKPRWSK